MKRIFTTLSQKWPEYLLEILVITIGILGAFALNNWSESRKKIQEQREIVANLNEEFSANLIALESQISRLEKKSNSCAQILNILSKDTLISQISLDTLIGNLFDSPSWNPSTYVLADLRNSGQLKSLRNEQLKKLLHEWEQHYENLREGYDLQFDVLSKNFEFISEEGSIRNTASNRVGKSRLIQNGSLLQSSKFENIVSINYVVTELLLSIYKNETLDIINEILKETE